MKNDFYDQNLHCIAPFSSLVLQLSEGVQPCCNWLPDENFPIDEPINSDVPINDLFDNANKKVRKIFLEKTYRKYKICNKCFESGQTQYVSHNRAAKDLNHDFVVNPRLTNLHIQPSNFCNLACRMCSPYNSNLLAKERDLDKTNDHRFNSKKKFEIKNISENTVLFESILKQLEFVNNLWFSGGEPLINREVWLILQYAVGRKYNNRISLKFNTNGTLPLTQEKYRILQSFNKLQLDISMDGVGDVAEYIRTNLKFDEWNRNFEVYKKLFTNQIELAYTASVFNIHLFDEYLEHFFSESIPISVNFCYWPEPLSPINLNDKAKKFIIEKYNRSRFKDYKSMQNIIQFLNHHMWGEKKKINIANYIENQDRNALEKQLYKKYRPYKEIQPEWFEYLKL